MKQGDTIILDITDYGSNGEGVAKHEGCVIFIPFAAVGEKIKARITFVKKSFAKAVVVEVLMQSPLRVLPPCNRFMRCGGCDIMHIDYAEQVRLKRNTLITTLKKNYKKEVTVDECVESPDIFAYRNKLMLPFGIVGGRVALGFYQEGTHKVVAITKCFLHSDWAEKLIGIALEYANNNELSVYDENSGKGLLRHLVARYIEDKLSITFVINGDKLPFINNLIRQLDNQFKNYSLYLSINNNRNNIIMGDNVKLLKGEPLSANINNISYTINPLSFLQVNDKIRDMIYDKILSKVKENKSDAVIDAYAGVGLLGAMIAKECIPVYNIEIIPEATKDAVKLSDDNAVAHLVTNICGDAATELPRLIKSIPNTYRNITIILDPPRKGCSSEVIAALNALTNNLPNIDKMRQNYYYKNTGEDVSATIDKDNQKDNQRIEQNQHTPDQDQPIINIIYISCNPATLSRDLALLSPNYHPASITPYDMFPHTKHLETLVCMTRK